MKLIINRSPIAGESLAGHLLRLTEMNLYGSPTWITGLVGADGATSSGRAMLANYVSELSDLTGTSTVTLSQMGYVRKAGERNVVTAFGGQRFMRSLINLTHAKVCPECLKESPHIRQVWELKFLQTCPDHGIRLVGRCPRCEKPISWTRSVVTHCKCGADLRKAEVTIASPSETLIATFIERSAGAQAPRFQSSNPEIKHMTSVQGVMEMVALIGWSLGINAHPSVKSVLRLKTEEQSGLLESAGAIFNDWPTAWHNVIRTHMKENDGFGYSNIFGPFYSQLFATDKTCDPVRILRDEFARYCTINGLDSRVTGIGDPTVHEHGTGQGYVSAQTAMKEIRVGENILRWLIKAGKLRSESVTTKRRKIQRINRGDIPKARAYLDSLIGTKEVADRLEVSKHEAAELFVNGAIKAVRGPTIDGYRNWVVESEEINFYIK